MIQGKVERCYQTLKNRMLLEYYYLPGDLIGIKRSIISVSPAADWRAVAAVISGTAIIAAAVVSPLGSGRASQCQSAIADLNRAALAQQARHQTSHNTSHIIMAARRMADGITPANARRTPLERRKLLHKALIIQERTALAVQYRQERREVLTCARLPVAQLVVDLVLDAVLAELLAHELARVCVTGDAVYMIGFQSIAEIGNRAFRG
jgi:hypothetical protein